jgi:hypothetical protein
VVPSRIGGWPPISTWINQTCNVGIWKIDISEGGKRCVEGEKCAMGSGTVLSVSLIEEKGCAVFFSGWNNVVHS